MVKEEKKGELNVDNISLVLNSYNDIFSSFDPRVYSEKALSDDFLIECEKAAVDKEEDFELRLLIPRHKRNINDEIKIKKRLKSHFQKHFDKESKKVKAIRREGLIWFFVGAIVMVAATFLYNQEGFWFNLLFIMAEPASWFMFWEGLYKVFIEYKANLDDYEFYKKMNKAQIYFLNY